MTDDERQAWAGCVVVLTSLTTTVAALRYGDKESATIALATTLEAGRHFAKHIETWMGEDAPPLSKGVGDG